MESIDPDFESHVDFEDVGGAGFLVALEFDGAVLDGAAGARVCLSWVQRAARSLPG